MLCTGSISGEVEYYIMWSNIGLVGEGIYFFPLLYLKWRFPKCKFSSFIRVKFLVVLVVWHVSLFV